MADRQTSTAEQPAAAPAGWSRPTFTAHLRGQDSGVPPLAEQEARLVHENSIAFGAVRAMAHVPGLRRLAGAVPSGVADGGPERPSLDTDALLATPLYRRLNGLRYSPAYRRIWAERLRPLVRGRRHT